MKIAIMQPYFLPYIGYFQLINAVDKFIVYDNIKYTKKGWINRNRILVNGKDSFITLPLQKDSDFLNVNERRLSDSWEDEKLKMLNKITESYRKSPYFDQIYPLIEGCIYFEDNNLFNFIYNSLYIVSNYIGIKTEFVISSTLNIDHSLKSSEKVLAICEQFNTITYINPIGGTELYSKDEFTANSIELKFLKSESVKYRQFTHEFTPWLSILDVIMFNSPDEVHELLDHYELI